MSAFLCSENTFKLLAAWGTDDTFGPKEDHEGASVVAKILWEANVDSLHARYGENIDDMLGAVFVGEGADTKRVRPPPPVVTVTDFEWVREISPIQVIKATDCLDYQACEYNGWKTSQARRLYLTSVRRQAFKVLGVEYMDFDEEGSCDLPGWRDAYWDMPEVLTPPVKVERSEVRTLTVIFGQE